MDSKSLTQKLCEVGKTLSWMKKRGKMQGGTYGYNYATEADLVSAIRLELYNRNVFLYAHGVDHKRVVETIVTVKDGKESSKGIMLTDVMIDWEWVDGDTGESRMCRMPGCGMDSGDKGLPKSITMSEKYFLLKTFLIPTYDDSEATLDAEEKRELQRKVAVEKTAALKAQKAAREAPSDEEAQKEARKAKVVFISLPDRFNGEYAAVYGTGIASEELIAFLGDCNATRYKGPEGIYWKLEIVYVNDCKAMVERLGMTLDYKE